MCLGASCSNRTVFLNLSGFLFICCLPSSFANVDIISFCSFRVVFLLRQMRPHVDPPSAPHSPVPPAPRSTRALSLSFTRSVSATLSLHAFILALPVKVPSTMVLISFSTFVVVWFYRYSMRCQLCTTRTTSSTTVSLDVSHTSRPSSSRPTHHSVSVSSNFSLAPLRSW